MCVLNTCTISFGFLLSAAGTAAIAAALLAPWIAFQDLRGNSAGILSIRADFAFGGDYITATSAHSLPIVLPILAVSHTHICL